MSPLHLDAFCHSPSAAESSVCPRGFLLSLGTQMGSHPGINLMISRNRGFFSLLTDSIGVNVLEIFGFQKQERLLAVLIVDADVDAMRSVACSHVLTACDLRF